jgi:hypothetical protein
MKNNIALFAPDLTAMPRFCQKCMVYNVPAEVPFCTHCIAQLSASTVLMKSPMRFAGLFVIAVTIAVGIAFVVREVFG